MKRSNIVIDWDSNWIDKEKPHISVSAAQGFWDEPFDKEGTAKRIMAEQFNNSRSKYFHMTTEMILEAWENKANAMACDFSWDTASQAYEDLYRSLFQ